MFPMAAFTVGGKVLGAAPTPGGRPWEAFPGLLQAPPAVSSPLASPTGCPLAVMTHCQRINNRLWVLQVGHQMWNPRNQALHQRRDTKDKEVHGVVLDTASLARPTVRRSFVPTGVAESSPASPLRVSAHRRCTRVLADCGRVYAALSTTAKTRGNQTSPGGWVTSASTQWSNIPPLKEGTRD